MEQMAELLEQARRQGIAEALQHVETWRATVDTETNDGLYLDGIDDAVLTINELLI